MSVEGVRVTMVHLADEWPVDWIHLLRVQCGGAEPLMVSADKATVEAILENDPHRILLLAPVDPELIPTLLEKAPLLVDGAGMCSLFAAYGGECPAIPEDRRPEENYLMHDGAGLWTGFMEPLEIEGYPHHAPDKEALPGRLMVTAWNDEGVVLAVRDRELPVVAWNFHPLDLPAGVGREMVLTFLEGKYLIDRPEGPPEI